MKLPRCPRSLTFTSKGGDKTPAMQRYEGMAYGDLDAAIDGLANRFRDSSDISAIIEKLVEAHSKRHRVYDRLEDLQQDPDEPLDLWAPAADRREEFDSLLAEARTLRKALIAAAEADILGVQ